MTAFPSRSPRHDRDTLDALEASQPELFHGRVWRVTTEGRDPLSGSTAPGRWSPTDEFEALYPSFERDGALIEIGYRLSLEPVWPGRLKHELDCIAADMRRVARFPDLRALETFGVDVARYGSFHHTATQALAAAAHFLDYNALIVPNARSPTSHLVVLLENACHEDALEVTSTGKADWDAWRRLEKSAAP